MAIPDFEQLDTADTFSDWLAKTNEMIELFANDVITANDGISVTYGNAELRGDFSANTLIVVDELRGGEGGINGDPHNVSADLNVVSNTIFTETAQLVTVTNETLLMGNAVAQSNLTIVDTETSAQTRIENADIDLTSANGKLSTVRTNDSGSLIIDADSTDGGSDTQILFRTDNFDALRIDQRDIHFFNDINESKVRWDAVNERLGIHVSTPTVELDVSGSTHTTDLTVFGYTTTKDLEVEDTVWARDGQFSRNVSVNDDLTVGNLTKTKDLEVTGILTVPGEVTFSSTVFTDATVDGVFSTKAAAAASTNRIAVFSQDPSTTARALQSRTPTDLLNDLDGVSNTYFTAVMGDIDSALTVILGP